MEAWAAWLRCDKGRFVRRGRCPDYVKDSTAAELAAIFAGLHLARRQWGALVTSVVVRSDCTGALALLKPGARRSKRPDVRRLQERIETLARVTGWSLRTRWVKGHQRAKSSTAAYLNNACDRLARKLREQRTR